MASRIAELLAQKPSYRLSMLPVWIDAVERRDIVSLPLCHPRRGHWGQKRTQRFRAGRVVQFDESDATGHELTGRSVRCLISAVIDQEIVPGDRSCLLQLII